MSLMIGHNNPPREASPPYHLREKLLKEAKNHRRFDMLQQGDYGSLEDHNFRGCSIGCFAYSVGGEDIFNHQGVIEEAHYRVSEYYQIPEDFIDIHERIFECTPPECSLDCHVEFAKAICEAPFVISWDEISENLVNYIGYGALFSCSVGNFCLTKYRSLTKENLNKTTPEFAVIFYNAIRTNGVSVQR